MKKWMSLTGNLLQITTGTNPSGGWGGLCAESDPFAVSLKEGEELVLSFDILIQAVPEGSQYINLELRLTGADHVSRAFSEYTEASVGDLVHVSWSVPVSAAMTSATAIEPWIPFEGNVNNFSTTGPNGNGTEIDVMQLDNIRLQLKPLATGFARFEEEYGLAEGAYGDDDQDGWKNIYEYGLGGNPTNSDENGFMPEFTIDSSTMVGCRHVINTSPDIDISYLVEQTTNLLISSSWTNVEWTAVTTNSHAADGFDEKQLQTGSQELPHNFFRFRITRP